MREAPSQKTGRVRSLRGLDFVLRLETQKLEITSANVLAVEAGSNCPQGGDAGHGGRTIFRLQDFGSTAMTAIVDGKVHPHAKEIAIVLGGDSEHSTFVEALGFALAVLRGQEAIEGAEPGVLERDPLWSD